MAVICMNLISCEPEQYSGPLDSPLGNWEGIASEYYFNGEQVAALDSCETTAISFYKQGLCCIEGTKGTFPFIYDESEKLLQIDSTLWKVQELTGAQMTLTYLYRILPPAKMPEPESQEETDQTENPDTSDEPVVEPDEPTVEADANGFILPIEYNGMLIEADEHGYYYINGEDKTTYCYFKGWENEDKTWTVDFWYDTHTDHFIPLVVETTKK